MLSYLLRNVARVASDPTMGVRYLAYQLNRVVHKGEAALHLRGVSLSGFLSFSEYTTTGDLLDDREYRFLTQHPFGPGQMIDVGANLGLVSLVLAKAHPTRTVYAFEPNPSTFEALRRNKLNNELENIEAFGVAVSDVEGRVHFDPKPESRATARITGTTERNSVEVPSTSLDRFWALKGRPPIALLKIDVEGYEETVLEGALKMLSTTYPVVYLEVCPENALAVGFDPRRPLEILTDLGYDMFRVDPNGSLVPANIDDISSVVLENWVGVKADD